MLKDWEQEARAAVLKSDAPFLGLLGDALPAGARAEILDAVSADCTVEGYVRLLYRYPALFAINLTSVLMSGVGQTGNFELYPHVRTALRLKREPTPDEREALWSAFRRAVLRLGLEVSPRTSGHHFMADMYLRQVGVPLAFADDLAERMLAFAKTAGIPERDDPEGVARWQAALAARLGQPFSRVAQRAVELDSAGFYSNVFIKVHEAGADAGWANPLEQAMARAFEKHPGGARLRRASMAYLALNDGCLGVFIPAGESARTVHVRVKEEGETLRVGAADQFFSLSDPLPFAVSVHDSDSQQVMHYDVWVDAKPNRMLLFTENGRFKGRAQLGMTDVLLLPPGRYLALCRFLPAGIEATELSVDPRLVLFPLTLHPGQKRTLTNGPAELTLQGEGRPLARWTGPVRTSKECVEFSYGALNLELEFPADWLNAKNNHFEVVLTSSSLGQNLALPVVVNEEGRAELPISEALLDSPITPGLSRILAEVRRQGEVRALLRTSVLYWSGLESVSEGLKFSLRRDPINLAGAHCENFSIALGLIQPRDRNSRRLTLAFRLDERRLQTLTWNAPGVFVEVGGVNGAGTHSQVSRPLGSTEVVSLTSSRYVVVSSSEAGVLTLGEWSQFTDFARQPSKRLQASFLASRLSANANTLTFTPAGSKVAFPLLKLVQPHHLQSISEKLVDGELLVKLASPNEIEALLVTAHEIVSGRDIEFEVHANSPGGTSTPLGRSNLMTLPDGVKGYVSTLSLQLEPSAAGAWIFRFEGRVAGRWGHLQNQRNDQFAVGYICDECGGQGSTASLVASVSALTDTQSLAVFARVHHELLPCYAETSWGSIKWLSTVWRTLMEVWRGREGEGIATFVGMACLPQAEESSPSWMPQHHIGADLPRIFAVTADDYRRVNENRHVLAVGVRAMARFQDAYPVVFGELLHPAAAMGFSNRAAIVRGNPPRGFSLSEYAKALHQTDAAAEDLARMEETDFLPGNGDLLGPVHFRHARKCLEVAYRTTLGGNEIRRGQAIGLCRYVKKVMPTLDGSLLQRLKGTRPHVDGPWPEPSDESPEQEEAYTHEILTNVAHFLSLLALHCRASARSAEHLRSFLSTLQASGLPVEGCMAYLIQVGDAFFAYYLLLWEVAFTSENTASELTIQ